ncbi:MAG: hypothetical protein LBR65_05820 [Culturomica sp.]|jgi:hypothetical protein|nr:hypothetical protein [Culturomica sp.]
MRTPEVKKFIEDHQYLFWYTPQPKSENVTDELLVEMVLNYGSLDEIHDLFKVAGLQKVAAIFWGMTGRKKLNYFPEIHNYFDMYFKKYVS